MVEGGEGRSLFTFGFGVIGRLYFPPYSTCWYPERDILAEEEAGASRGRVLLWIRGPLNDFSMTFSNSYVGFCNMPGCLPVL